MRFPAMPEEEEFFVSKAYNPEEIELKWQAR